jgi:hypothetical protein
MPKRRRTRAADNAARITAQRHDNATQRALAAGKQPVNRPPPKPPPDYGDDPPPF